MWLLIRITYLSLYHRTSVNILTKHQHMHIRNYLSCDKFYGVVNNYSIHILSTPIVLFFRFAHTYMYLILVSVFN